MTSRRYVLPDQASFVALPRGTPAEACRFIGHLFATDGRAVFSTRGALKEVDPATFKLVEESSEPDLEGCFHSAYAVTADKAVYVDELHAPKFFRPQALAQLRVLAPHFATDGVAVFCDGVKVTGADAASFRPVSCSHGVDRRYCYFRSARIAEADPGSFGVLGEFVDRGLGLSYDRSALHLHGQRVLGLSGGPPALHRDERGHVTGVFDGERLWSLRELEAQRQSAARPLRAVVFAEHAAPTRWTDDVFEGLEQDLSLFLVLCTHKTLEALEQFTRGRKGEKAVLRCIERLNERLSSRLGVKLAVVSPAEIQITAEGVAVYRQYGAVSDVVGAFLAGFKVR